MDQDRLILHFIRSPFGINWSSPRALTISGAMNMIAAGAPWGAGHGIGHLNIEIAPKGKKSILTGITVKDMGVYYELLSKQQIGFGVLFHRFAGRLESEEEILESLAAARKHRRLSSLELPLPAGKLDACLGFVEGLRALGDRLQYGFPCDPHKREGAGCTAYGVGFLEVAGLMKEEYQAWRRSLVVPGSWIGESGRRVPVRRAFFGHASKAWFPDEESRELEFWCPDLMFDWSEKNKASSR